MRRVEQIRFLFDAVPDQFRLDTGAHDLTGHTHTSDWRSKRDHLRFLSCLCVRDLNYGVIDREMYIRPARASRMAGIRSVVTSALVTYPEAPAERAAATKSRSLCTVKNMILGPAIFGAQAVGRLQSIENWHRYVNYEHVRIETFCLCDSISSIIYGSNDVKVRGEYSAYPVQNCLMIIRKQHSDPGHTLCLS